MGKLVDQDYVIVNILGNNIIENVMNYFNYKTIANFLDFEEFWQHKKVIMIIKKNIKFIFGNHYKNNY